VCRSMVQGGISPKPYCCAPGRWPAKLSPMLSLPMKTPPPPKPYPRTSSSHLIYSIHAFKRNASVPIARSANSDSPLERQGFVGNNSCVADFALRLKAILRSMALCFKARMLYGSCSRSIYYVQGAARSAVYSGRASVAPSPPPRSACGGSRSRPPEGRSPRLRRL